jgi:hypothetical protein
VDLEKKRITIQGKLLKDFEQYRDNQGVKTNVQALRDLLKEVNKKSAVVSDGKSERVK